MLGEAGALRLCRECFQARTGQGKQKWHLRGKQVKFREVASEREKQKVGMGGRHKACVRRGGRRGM